MKNQTTSGFTLIEVLVVTIMVGVLAAIATPSWVAFNQRQQLNAANNQIYQALRQAQTNAKLQKETWQASFHKQSNGTVWWAIHRTNNPPGTPPNSSWQSFPSTIQITTQTNYPSYPSYSNSYQLLFNYKGCPVSATSETCTNSSLSFYPSYSSATPPPRIVLSIPNGTAKLCVMVLTRLGTVASGQDEGCY